MSNFYFLPPYVTAPGRNPWSWIFHADLTVQGLKDKISAEYPNLKESMSSVLITINREYAFDEAVIPQNAETGDVPAGIGRITSVGRERACRTLATSTYNEFPNHFSITEDEIDLNDLLAKITLVQHGRGGDLYRAWCAARPRRGECA